MTSQLDALRIITFVNQHLDSPSAELRAACRELLKDLESRLLTDAIMSGLTINQLLESAPTCN